MKRTCLLIAFTAAAFFAKAQVGLDSAGSAPPPPPPVSAPVSAPPDPVAPPPPPPPPVVTPVAPATTTTTTTSSTTTAPAATTVYVPGERRSSIDVNRIRFGAFIAPNISWMRPTASTDDAKQFNVQNDGSVIGFTYGLMAEYFFAENYGFVTGLSINSTGGKITATSSNTAPGANSVTKAAFQYRLQYLDVPIALKLRTDEINKFRFFGQLGVSVGFNLSKKADYTVTYMDSANASKTVSESKIKLTNIDNSINNIAPVMFQMNLGIGAEYPLNNKLRAYAALFFNNGFAPDATNPDKFDSAKLGYKGTFKDGNTRLNNFALRIGLFF